ncbi:MAG: 1,4-dihydroxy-2-naphthoate octaprenyltransferase [candidate division Zixibacteria bacterium RBG_16_43_9]|nr:MAG: 1,4-dihydroxy-2-naphthoate octaprenyltransferase [candidate division Zixibacteria bacterium RBG_16_43_9]
MKEFLKKWIKAVRAPFFTATLVPVAVGSTLAYSQTGRFNWVNFFLTLFGFCFIHAGANLANDYFDHKTTDDDINRSFTPFSGGSRVIQDGIVPAKHILNAALIFFGLGSIIGLYLNYVSPGNIILLFGLFGVVTAFFYTASPVMMAYHGWGELMIGLDFGVLAVMGSFFVQAHSLNWSAFWASLPVAFMITGILYINQFQDYEADKTVKKNHWVVRLGKKKAVYGYYLIIAGTYISIIISVVSGLLPFYALIALFTLPLAYTAIKVLRANYDKIYELIPANASTIKIHLFVGLLLSFGFILSRLI